MEIAVIADKLKSIIAEVKNDQSVVDSVKDSTDLVTELGIDSLQLINLLLSIEDEFQVEIDFDGFDIIHLNCFSRFCEFVADCIKKKSNEDTKTDELFTELTGNNN
jgi:acyl carrier protein